MSDSSSSSSSSAITLLSSPPPAATPSPSVPLAPTFLRFQALPTGVQSHILSFSRVRESLAEHSRVSKHFLQVSKLPSSCCGTLILHSDLLLRSMQLRPLWPLGTDELSIQVENVHTGGIRTRQPFQNGSSYATKQLLHFTRLQQLRLDFSSEAAGQQFVHPDAIGRHTGLTALRLLGVYCRGSFTQLTPLTNLRLLELALCSGDVRLPRDGWSRFPINLLTPLANTLRSLTLINTRVDFARLPLMMTLERLSLRSIDMLDTTLTTPEYIYPVDAFPSLTRLVSLTHLEFVNVPGLRRLPTSGLPESLADITLQTVIDFTDLSFLENHRKLDRLVIQQCDAIRSIEPLLAKMPIHLSCDGQLPLIKSGRLTVLSMLIGKQAPWPPLPSKP